MKSAFPMVIKTNQGKLEVNSPDELPVGETFEIVSTSKTLIEDQKDELEKLVSKFLSRSRGIPYDFSSDQIFTWVIKDEGGVDYTSNAPPQVLAYVRGTYKQAIEFAVRQKGFWGYGPGYIKKIQIVELD